MSQPSAQNAINTLQSLREIVGPASVAYFIGPNVILTLSGARGYADGVFYSENKASRETWRQEIASAIEALKTVVDVYGFDVNEEKNPRGNDYVGYDFMLREGLEYSLGATQLLAASPDQVLEQAESKTLLETIVDNLKQNPDTKQYSDSSQGDIAFGIMLGYPDKAIIGSVGQWWHQGDRFSPRMIQADIRGAGYYRCPQPVYYYPRNLVSDPGITQHEAMWSGILRDFYESDFHQELKGQLEFQNKLRALGK